MMFFEGKMSRDVLINGCGAGTKEKEKCSGMKGCAFVDDECLPEYHRSVVERKNQPPN